MAPHIIPFTKPYPGRRRAVVSGVTPPAAVGPDAVTRIDEATATHLALNAEDGTIQLLRSGFCVAGAAAVALLLTLYVLGGVGPDGARSSLGWLSLMIALMSMPFGLLMLLLGGAKWLRNHQLSRRRTVAHTLPPR